MRLTRQLFVLAICTLAVGTLPLRPARAADDLSAYIGTWVDTQNENMRMVVSEDDGLLRIAGGDEAYGFNLACVVSDDSKAACVGDGGKLEGENFLYESAIVFNDDGTASESWKAFNNQQQAEGTTQWRREGEE